jgi:GPH family glycoside/pentoside/hexuronide:cation symporter
MPVDVQSVTGMPRHAVPDLVVPSWRLAAYAMPAVALAMLSGPIVVFLPNFYVTEQGLSLAVVGAIFFAARLWDGISDIVVGLASDGTRSRWGRRYPWIVCAAPVLCLAVLVLLNPPEGAGPVFLFLGLIVTYTAWTAIQVPYLAWGAAISSDHDVRGRVFGMREVATVIGSLGTVLLPYAVTGLASPPLSEVLQVLGLSIVLILAVSVPSALLLGPVAAGDVGRIPVAREGFVQVVRNGPFLHALGIAFVTTLALLVFTAGVFF